MSHRSQAGFTLVEVMIALAIAATLAGLAIPAYVGYLDKARLARCIAEIRYIERAVDAYEAANGTLPDSLDQVGADELVDPWGNGYLYLNIAALSAPGNGSGNGNAGGNGGGNGAGGNSGGNGGGNNGSGAGSGGSGGSGNSGGNGNGSGNSGGNGGGKKSMWLPWSPDEAYAAAGGKAPAKPRKDRFLHPISSDYDLYSMGKDGESVEPLTAKKSHDDVIRANDGNFVGLASDF